MKFLMAILCLGILLPFTGCRFPVDINVDRYLGLQLNFVSAIDGSPMANVEGRNIDPSNWQSSGSDGSVKLLVYTQATSALITVTWDTKVPVQRRVRQWNFRLGKGLNVYRLILQDNPYLAYKVSPDAPTDWSAEAYNEESDSWIPVEIFIDDGGIYNVGF